MMASLSQATLQRYTVTYKIWWQFCNQHAINPFNASVSSILVFLQGEFSKNSSYGTLNYHRSAFALISQVPIGNDATLKKFFKGIFRLRPQRPKYACTWDPAPFLMYLGSNFPLPSLTFEQLTKNLVTFLALSTAQRTQTPSKINVENIVVLDTELYIIRIPDMIKTSAVNKLQPLLVLPFFPNKKELCVASTLLYYIKRTKKIRHPEDKIFLTTRRPHRPASVKSLSRWIKTTLAVGGIGISVFIAHSTRHASTSQAFRNGIDLDTIRKVQIVYSFPQFL